MWMCEDDEKMWRWEDVKMWGCEDEKMWRWEDVKMWGCECVKMMRKCEDEKMWGWEHVKMRRCEDEKMRDRPPLLEEPCAQTLSGKTLDCGRFVQHGSHPPNQCCSPMFALIGYKLWEMEINGEHHLIMGFQLSWCVCMHAHSGTILLVASHALLLSPGGFFCAPICAYNVWVAQIPPVWYLTKELGYQLFWVKIAQSCMCLSA